MALNQKQIAFCDEYLANKENAYQAALAAGYAEKTARDVFKWIKKESLKKPYKLNDGVKMVCCSTKKRPH